MISRWLGIRSVWLSLVLISASWSGLFWHQCHTSPTSSLLLVSECCSSLSAAEIRESTSPRTTCGSAFADAASVIGTTETTDEEVDASSVNGSTIRATPESTHSIHRLQQQQPSPSEKRRATMNQILLKAGRKGLGGGIPGAVAGIIQVVLLMWLRTVINYQSRYGTSFFKAVQILYREGGVGRFYRGVGFALFQAPLSRFVSTASNDGVLAFLASFPLTQNWGPGITTCFASIFVGTFRMILMPVVSSTSAHAMHLCFPRSVSSELCFGRHARRHVTVCTHGTSLTRLDERTLAKLFCKSIPGRVSGT